MRSETLFKHDLRTRILIFLNSVTLETAGGKIRIWLNFSKGKILVPVCNLISAQLNTGEATLHKLFSRNSNSHRYYIRILMQRRPSVDVVSTSIRRRLNVNSTPTLKQRQFNNCMTPMSIQRYFYAYGMLISST